MKLLDADNLLEFLKSRGRLAAGDFPRIERLSGGVSNEVFYVAFPAAPERDFVLKQSREQLRVPDPWFSRLERVWREVEVLRVCQELLESAPQASPMGSPAREAPEFVAATPRILFEERDEYAFAMTAAPREHAVWKRLLLAGRADPRIAAACGALLGRLHAGSWGSPQIAARLGDRAIFDELRLDPYYRAVARQQPEWRDWLSALVASVESHPRCLVHADFSPKNLLVYPGGLMMVDFETGHFGDPAFDLGFFLSHLVLKAHERAPQHEDFLALIDAFWTSYRPHVAAAAGAAEYAALVSRGLANLAGCALARLEGKSRVDYLADPLRRARVHEVCWFLRETRPDGWPAVAERIRAGLKNLTSSESEPGDAD